MPAMIANKVDLPHPLGPSKAITSPGFTSNDIPERTFASLNDLSMPVIWRMGSGIMNHAPSSVVWLGDVKPGTPL